MRDYWGVSLLLLEMEFYLWCEEIVEYDYICYDYFNKFIMVFVINKHKWINIQFVWG